MKLANYYARNILCLVGQLSFLLLLVIIPGNVKAAAVLPFDLVQNKPVVAACIQKECGKFLVDFGASGIPDIYLSKQFISKLTDVRVLNKTISTTNITGKPVKNPVFEANGLILAGKRINKVTFSPWIPWGVTLVGKSHETPLMLLDGVIGLDIFKKFGTVALDYAHRRFILGVMPNNTHFVWKNFMLDDNGISMTAIADGHTYRFVLDTGANRSVIRRTHLVKGAQLESCGTPRNQNFNCSLYTPTSFRFGNLNGLKPTFIVTSYKEPDYDGIIGGDILSHIHLLLDFKNDTFFVQGSFAK